MNKFERQAEISRLVNKNGTIRVADIVKRLNVTDMTVRRDLAELEKQGILTKIHGGAKSNNAFQYREFSHEEKQTKHAEAKRKIALKAAELINDGDTIFLGPGTTVEELASEINNKKLTVVTNCWPVFRILLPKKTDGFRIILLGGEIRPITSAFVGEITNSVLDKMRFTKVFFSSNGVKNGNVMTSTFEEAYTQKLAILHSVEKYLLIDNSKIDKDDFAVTCQLQDLTAVVSADLTPESREQIENLVEIIE